MLLLLFLAALILAQHPVHVLLVEQQLAHLIARTPVFGISISLQFCLFLLSAYRKLPCPARMPDHKKAGAAYLAASRPHMG